MTTQEIAVSRAMALGQQHTKDAIVGMARAAGWRGDEARATKDALCMYVAEREAAGQPYVTAAAQQGPSPLAALMQAEAAATPSPASTVRYYYAEARWDHAACSKCGQPIKAGTPIYGDKAKPNASRYWHAQCHAEQPGESIGASVVAEDYEATAKPQPAAVKPSPAVDATGPAAMIQAAIAAMMASQVPALDESRVKELIAEHAPKGEAQHVRIVVTAAGEVTMAEHTHPVFDKVLRLLGQGQNVLLKGPAGCGKSFLAAQLAKAMQRGYGSLHCSAGASESQLLGWLLPTGEGGRFEYVAAQFARLFAEGKALFLVDEIDAADPNFLMVLNGALANGHLHVPQNWKQPSVERGADFAVLAAANTFGHGADALYVGRNQLDAATLDRFYVVEMDYDAKLEAQLGTAEVCKWVWNLRQRVADLKLRRVVSTRTIQRMTAGLQAGLTFAEVKADALLGWTRDERSKVGE